MVSGEVMGSRWGMRGVEDLGGGLSTIFRLESGYNPNTGKAAQGGAAFGRQAYVGLSSVNYGAVTLGRQANAAFDLWSPFTATGSTIGDFSSHPMDNDNADADYKASNAVKYVSPLVRGLQVEASYAFSNSTAFADNREYSIAGTYTAGSISGVAAYTRSDNPSSASNPSGAVSATTAFGFVASSTQNIDFGLRWTYSGANNVALSFSHVDVYALKDGTIGNNVNGITLSNQNSWKFDNLEINTQYFFTPSLSFAGAYTFTHAGIHGASYSSANWHQAAVMLNYALSKGTSVYAQAAYQHANDAAATTLGTDVEGLGRSSSENQVLARLGILHKF